MINVYNIIGLIVFVAMGSAILYIIANIVAAERKAELLNCVLISLAVGALGYFMTLFGTNGAMASIPVMLVASLLLIKYVFDAEWQRSFLIWASAIILNAIVLAVIYFAAVAANMPFALVVI